MRLCSADYDFFGLAFLVPLVVCLIFNDLVFLGFVEKKNTSLFTTESKGQGFGLAVVKRMSEALGGSVSFESQEGKGTKFIVCLPNLFFP